MIRGRGGIPGGRGGALLAWVLIAGVLTGGSPAAAQAPRRPVARAAAPKPAPPATARLEGPFLLSGHVTVATDVLGEHVGQRVSRRWTFTSLCRTGPCAEVALVRARAAGRDRLTLRMSSPGSYTGTGSFYAPLRCGAQINHRGELVPFKITVRITGAEVLAGAVLATQVTASYVNISRVNLTSCVAILGHDAASYEGRLQL